ncbi:UDP-N-acetylglucosamine--N-acetylmuramyl-(pentapeptide) pyrophosphoryl-undecaprenol N-acetylglucosamine transferase [Pikeienuella piscinae]|uniref:UDP-N-acetylglucosamine--N-acetylmuramyl-(pentapeptide) pyrophosphoryl-undecaprenol N-acetylglucosamine transferase n=1 Tax=Pikeienuella piscinae TaxID=2748098 RepID=A0A7M3T6M2_9RHOB|nr:UDP-N-acetylglucosamine--N-acetylmuramyl-(pentapeptide) pyrophosphoryl-undecaprenol N-acetylglucosamine transferase [Pikeienuella piscinae]QIE57653.1 UDP-N-acetylglucosamine--N-acetylmuramyl-(pentapeptide) pyrophosphoryl-undecaprenol N-acetylglucosamine transferase [Pikeienuella piscinae]
MTDARLLVIAAGGTGGHMFPAQALAEEMLARGWRVALSTDDRGLRYAGGFPEDVERRALSAATFARGGLGAKALAPFRILKGVIEAVRWFRADRPTAVAGFGGYPSLPALAAAARIGAPRLIHEQNGVLGRVNRLFARRVDALACGVWPVSNAPEGARLVEIGNPIRAAAKEAMKTPYAPPGEGPLNLLVFGGSQGASVFARLLPEALAALPGPLRARLRVTTQAREAEAAELAAALGEAAEVAPFFSDMPARIAAAQLVICRAGASTVAELAAIGRPSILVPYPAAMDDHQTANAASLVAAGAAILAPETGSAGVGLTGAALAGHIRAVLEAPEHAVEMAAAARRVGRPEAAAALGDLVERISEGNGTR